MTTHSTRLPLAAGCAAILLSATCAFAGETPFEGRGEEIYMHGRGARHPITATVGSGTASVPATAMPCASCHGPDGRGRTEGGVTPTDLTFESLTRPYTVTTPTARSHGPYDERTLRRAITHGIDPEGNALNAVMPRYAMSEEDMDALLAYMKQLGRTPDPGLTPKTIRLGVVLPPQETMPDAASETRAIVNAWFQDVNRKGGIFGRTIDLSFMETTGNADKRAKSLRTFLGKTPVFALVSSFSEGAERELAAVADEQRVPFVATITSNPSGSTAPSAFMRELFAGVSEQSRALVRLAARDKPGTKLAILGAPRSDAREAAALEAKSAGLEIVETFAHPEMVLVLDVPALHQFLSTLDPNWKPTLLAPASVADPNVLANAAVPSFIAFPTLPIDYTAESLITYERLVREHGIGTTHRATQTAALASASLMTDALTRAGRELSRHALLDAIDATNAFYSGYAPPFTFRGDRHIGSTGCHVVYFEPGQAPKSTWVEVE